MAIDFLKCGMCCGEHSFPFKCQELCQDQSDRFFLANFALSVIGPALPEPVNENGKHGHRHLWHSIKHFHGGQMLRGPTPHRNKPVVSIRQISAVSVAARYTSASFFWKEKHGMGVVHGRKNRTVWLSKRMRNIPNGGKPDGPGAVRRK